MAFNDLNILKKINGVPADIRYFDQIAENDSFFKNVSDSDENLEALDRDIVPTITNTYKIGLSNNIFSEVNTNLLNSNSISVLSGSLAFPSLKIGNAGFASLANNQLSFIGSSGIESFRFMTSGAVLRAANNTQFKIENTLPGSTAEWVLGCDATGFSFINSQDNSTKLKIKNDYLSVLNKLNVPNGLAVSPSIYFDTDIATGFFKDATLPILNFSVSGVTRLSVSSDKTQILSNKIIGPTGTEASPGFVFSNGLETGFYGIDSDNIGLSFNGKLVHKFYKEGIVSEIDGVSLNMKRVYSAPGLPSWHVDSYGRANGTKEISTPNLNLEELYVHGVEGYTDTGWQRVTEILAMTTEDYTSGSYGSKLLFSIVPSGTADLVEVLNLGSASNAFAHIPLSFGLGKTDHSTTGIGQTIDVSNTSKLMIDTSSGSIQIKGFTGGKEGQILYLYKKVPTNTLTIVFNDATATQKVLLKGSANYVNTNDYGGITLSFDDGVWREVSRS